jgi:hypothetical protein
VEQRSLVEPSSAVVVVAAPWLLVRQLLSVPEPP